jgi:hypothetical protein
VLMRMRITQLFFSGIDAAPKLVQDLGDESRGNLDKCFDSQPRR